MRLRPASLLLACILPFAAGCSRSAPHSAPPPTGAIQGSITFSGVLPPSSKPRASQSSGCPANDLDPFLRRQDHILPHTRPPVFLWISGGLENRTFPAPHQRVVLNQIECRLHPRIVGVMPHQPVDFTNSDLHPLQLHVAPTVPGNPTLNLTVVPQKPGQVRTFPHPELLIPVTSPHRPSVHAFINVVPNPFFTLAGPNGHFTLRHLPPGTYSLSAIRPGFPTQTQSVTVRAHAITHTTFTFGNASPTKTSSRQAPHPAPSR